METILLAGERVEQTAEKVLRSLSEQRREFDAEKDFNSVNMSRFMDDAMGRLKEEHLEELNRQQREHSRAIEELTLLHKKVERRLED